MSDTKDLTVTLVDTSIEAWLDAGTNPGADFSRELTSLVDKYRVQLPAEKIATVLEALAKAIGGAP